MPLCADTAYPQDKKGKGMSMPTIEDAIILATEARRGQTDKIGQPYVSHPLRVMLSLGSPQDRMVGVLHDVVEDTPLTPEDLAERDYPEEIVEAVDALSKRSGETYEEYIERVHANPIAVRVKIADLEDNLQLWRMAGLKEKALDKVKQKIKAYRSLKDAAES